MRRYLESVYKRIFREEKIRYRHTLNLMVTLTIIFTSARALAETLELFPVAINPVISWLGINFAYRIASAIDFIYGLTGYFLTPEYLLEPEYPEEIHMIYLNTQVTRFFNTPVWVISLWIFSFIWIFGTYIIISYITYLLARVFNEEISFKQIFVWTGVAFIPWMNWWFYIGSETMFEILPQKIYIDMFPPFRTAISIEDAIGKPNVLAIEQYWDMWSIGFLCLIWSMLLFTFFITRLVNVDIKRGILISLPWYIYSVFLVIGSLDVYSIVYWLRKLGAWEYGLFPFIVIPIIFVGILPKINQHKIKWQRWRWLSLIIITVIYFWSMYPYPYLLEGVFGNPVIEWEFWWAWLGIIVIFTSMFLGRISCGWFCPYAIFHELMSKVKIPRLPIPEVFRRRRWEIFFGLLIVIGTIEIFWEWDFLILYCRIYTILSIILAFIWVPRAWCRHLCVLGAYAQAYSKTRLYGIKVDPNKCQRCDVCKCQEICPADIDWRRYIVESDIWVLPDECWLCFKCIEVCPNKAVSFGRLP